MRSLILTALLLSSFIHFGQDAPGRKLTAETKDHEYTGKAKIGFKAGFNRSHVKGHDLSGAKTGYIGGELYAGFFFDIGLSRSWSIENELLFSWTNDYHFIEIPVHLKYAFARKWSAFGGPKLDVIVDNDNDPFESGYQFRNFGVSAELGLQHNILRRFFAEIRYARSFTKQVTDLFLDIYDGKRNTFRAGVGIVF
ncbi:MAG: PorT family protein [Chitinophagaceae bacterium]|nr:PorT family protein [Chitinophagaceae bacterium]